MQQVKESDNSKLSRGLYGGFLAVLLWAPLPLASNRLWSQSLLSVLLLILGAVMALGFLTQRLQISTVLRRGWWLAVPLLWVAGWAWVQSKPALALSVDAASTAQDALFSSALVIAFLLAMQLIDSHHRLRFAGYVLVASAVFQASYGSLMVMTGVEYSFLIPKEAYTGNNTGTFVNRNSQAGYLVMCLSLGVGLMVATLNPQSAANWRESVRRILAALISRKIVLRTALLIIVAGLVMTHSRMGNTSFFAALTLMGMLGLLLQRKATFKMALLLASLLALDVLVMGTFFGVEKLAQRIETTVISEDGRADIIPTIIELTQDNLVRGTGHGSFYAAFTPVKPDDLGDVSYQHAHNDYLEFTSQIGVLGIAPLALLVLATLIATLYVQRKRQDRLYRGVGFGVSMAIVAMLIHLTVDFNLQMPANAVTFVVLLAFAWIAALQPRGGKSA